MFAVILLLNMLSSCRHHT